MKTLINKQKINYIIIYLEVKMNIYILVVIKEIIAEIRILNIMH